MKARRPARSASYAWLGWGAVALFVASAAAQDVELSNPYARPQATAPEPAVHGMLARALSDKVRACYRAEQGKELGEEEQALLDEYRSDVARDLAPALTAIGCELANAPSRVCRQALDALDCQRLAEPIVAAGWDRNLSPEARAQVEHYAKALAARETGCSERSEEEASLVEGVRGARLSALIEAEIVMGKCELVPDQLSACETQVAATDCAEFSRLNEQGQLSHLCTTLMRCTDLPAP